MLADWVHLTAMSLWFGGLILIVGLVPPLLHGTAGATQRQAMAAIIGRFSQLGLISMAVLTITGIYAVTVHTTRDTVGTTTYGLVVIGKVALVACIVLRRRLQSLRPEAVDRAGCGEHRSGARPDDAPARHGRGGDPRRCGDRPDRPPDATAAGEYGRCRGDEHDRRAVGACRCRCRAAGSRIGRRARLLTIETKGTDETFDARITDSAGNVRTDVTRVTIWLNSGDKDVGLLTVPLTASGDGHYRATGQWFAIGQNWLARVIVRRQDVAEDVQLPFALQPRPTAYIEEPVSPSPFLWPRLLPDAWKGIDPLLIGLALLAFGLIVRLYRSAVRRTTWIGAIGLIVLGATLMAWYSVPTTPLTGRANPVAATQDALAQGAALYAQNCAVCHGAGGAGNGKPGTQLTASTGTRYTDGDLYWLLTNGVAGRVCPHTTAVSHRPNAGRSSATSVPCCRKANKPA